MVVCILILFLCLVFASGIMMATWVMLVGAAMVICRCRRIPFDPSQRLVRHFRNAAVVPALVFLYLILRPFWVPDQKTFASPDGNYTVTVGFYENLFSIDDYRVKIALHDVGTGQTLREVRHNIRDIFVTAFETHNGIAWESALLIEWDSREGTQDRVRVVYPEMNTAILLPSGTWVFPLSDLEPYREDVGHDG